MVPVENQAACVNILKAFQIVFAILSREPDKPKMTKIGFWLSSL